MSKNQTPQQNDDEQLSANEQQILEEIRGDVVDVGVRHVEDYGRDDNPAVGILRKHASEGDKRPQQSLRELGISPQTNAEAAASGGDGSMAGHVFATNADEDVREVRLVDDPEKGEHVELFDPRDAGSVRNVSDLTLSVVTMEIR